MKNAFSRILLSVDGSIVSQAAIDKTIQLATPGTTTIHVLGVAEPPSFNLGEAGPVEYIKECQSQIAIVEHDIENVTGRLSAARFLSQPVIKQGPAKTLIVEQATALSVDLVVLGAPEHGVWQCGLRGCTACWVTKHSPCSVLVVREAT
jgi:nucleotide-binding universal stress UspA family protein